MVGATAQAGVPTLSAVNTVGSLIARCGPLLVSFAGGGAFAASAAVMLLAAPPTRLAFAAGMGLCGLAWNLLFSSGTILLTTLYRPEDAIRIQGANDVVIFGVAGLGSCASGPLYERGGWPLVVGASAAGVALELVVLVGLYGLARPGRARPGRATAAKTAAAHLYVAINADATPETVPIAADAAAARADYGSDLRRESAGRGP